MEGPKRLGFARSRTKHRRDVLHSCWEGGRPSPSLPSCVATKSTADSLIGQLPGRTKPA